IVTFQSNIWGFSPSCHPLPPCDFKRIPFRNEEVGGSIPPGSTDRPPVTSSFLAACSGSAVRVFLQLVRIFTPRTTKWGQQRTKAPPVFSKLKTPYDGLPLSRSP